jgi:hypothetical protein
MWPGILAKEQVQLSVGTGFGTTVRNGYGEKGKGKELHFQNDNRWR